MCLHQEKAYVTEMLKIGKRRRHTPWRCGFMRARSSDGAVMLDLIYEGAFTGVVDRHRLEDVQTVAPRC